MSWRRSAPNRDEHRAVRTSIWCLVGLTAMVAGAAPAVAATSHRDAASLGPAAVRLHSSSATVGDAVRCARPAHRVHFKKDRAVVAVAVGMAESYCEKDAVGHNPPTSGCPNGSDDRGLWQINSCYHPEVSDHCAFKPTCNARAAKRISDHGRDWSPWSAFNSGAYRQYLVVAKHAVHRIWRRA
jgi:hypothetical protein